jgi:hypothetical protein
MSVAGPEASLVFTLQVLAAWRKCSRCGQQVLYVNDRGGTSDHFICAGCEQQRIALAIILVTRGRQ